MTVSIRKKFLGTIAIVILFLFCLSVFLLGRLNGATRELEQMYQSDYSKMAQVGEIDGLLTRVDINILRMIAIGDPTSVATWKQENIERFTKTDAALAKLAESSEGAQLASVKSLEDAYRKMQAGMTHQVQMIEKGDIPGGAEVNRLEVKDNANRVFTTLADMKKTLEASAATRFRQQQDAAQTARMIALGAVLAATAISIALGLFVVRNLLAQLGGEPDYAVAITKQIADGDLTVNIDVDDSDRGSLLYAMRTMRDNLAKLIGEVRGSTGNIASASLQIAAGNADLASRTEEQGASLQQTASSIEELTSTVKQNADNARQANQLAVNASEVATKGGAVVSEVVQTMGAINDSARKIVDIIAVIDGIAFQTNILALNAAVEAARAGEQGRGFAVVASEVRNLAQRSAAAAKEIKALIDNSVEKVDIGSKLVDQAGITMKEVVGAIGMVTGIMAEISAASQEQTSGIEQVNQAISRMDQATQQNATLVEETASGSESLRKLADKQMEIIALFKLDNRPNQAAISNVVALPRKSATAAPKAITPPSKRLGNAANGSDWEEF